MPKKTKRTKAKKSVEKRREDILAAAARLFNDANEACFVSAYIIENQNIRVTIERIEDE
jgi:organic hydroperoxide reductase OsmC/OhrA